MIMYEQILNHIRKRLWVAGSQLEVWLWQNTNPVLVLMLFTWHGQGRLQAASLSTLGADDQRSERLKPPPQH